MNLAAGTATGSETGTDTLDGIENAIGGAGADTLTGDAGANTRAMTRSRAAPGTTWCLPVRAMTRSSPVRARATTHTMAMAAPTRFRLRAPWRGSRRTLRRGLPPGPRSAAIRWTASRTRSAAPGDDTLTGDAGANTLTGGAGDDTLEGGAGDDTLDGGTGTDTASYAGAGAGVTADLAMAANNTGEAAGDAYAGIENLTGSAFADTLTGDAGANTLTGGAGDDTLQGGAGDDTVFAGAGDDTIIAGEGPGNDAYRGDGGTDTITFTSTLAGVTADLAAGTATGSEIGSDTLDGIENAIGGAGDDTLTGDAGANTLTGGAGDDTLTGGLGNDELIGGTGSDTLMGAAGSDTLVWQNTGEGNIINTNDPFFITSGGDVLVGFESGIDTLEFDGNAFGLAPGGVVTGVSFSIVGTAYTGTNPGENSNHDNGIGTFIYSTSTDTLYYDGNGEQVGYEVVATVDSGGDIAAGDITVV